MLKKIRVILAALFFVAITLLFLDFTGTLHGWLGWLAKIQFLPAVLALNVAVIVALVLLTILFGRVYCSVICPLGVFQDVVANISRKGKKGKYSYSKEIKWLRYGVWVLFVVAIVVGVNAFVALLEPYSAWGRIVNNLLAPVYQWGNNLLAYFAERKGSYAFYTKEVWLKSLPVFLVAVATLVALVILAWKNGRTYCNTICPVGTTLSFFSRFAMFRPTIDPEKCKNCHGCEKHCKAACIDSSRKAIDYSRCVDCFNCVEACKFGAINYRFAWNRSAPAETVPSDNKAADNGRRAFLIGSTVALTGLGLKAQELAEEADTTVLEKENEGGFATIIPKKSPHRDTPLTPFGSESLKKFGNHCTACQLCVSVCPNNVLRPSKDPSRFMQPEMSFERGYCRPECVKCSEVCPTGAILKITPEEKTTWKVGTASVDYSLCIVSAGEVEECGNCARHCPVGAIKMVRKDPDEASEHPVRIPTVNEAKCIGCGACENLCPARPISAIKVNGCEIHHTV